MDPIRLRGEGLTWAEISDRLGYHPATLSKWFREGGPPVQRSFDDEHRVLDVRWRARIDEILTAKPRLLATSVHAILAAENFGGSYPTVARYVNVVRGPRFRAAAAVSVPIETGPGEEGQFDWTDCNDWAERWGWTGELVCFGAVLCWSRLVWWWFVDSLDRQHTFEGLARFFEHVGGVPTMMRTDRMGALGRSQGRRFSLHPPTLEFATAHGIEITTCQSRDAKRKGKIERPFRPLKEAFLEELDLAGVPVTIDELNQRVRAVARDAGVAEGTSHDRDPADRASRFGGAAPEGVASTAVRHRVRRSQASASRVAADRVARRALLGSAGLSRSTGRGPP